MRILFLSSYVDPGSGASILMRLANRLQARGEEVRILTTSSGYDSELIRSALLPPGIAAVNRTFNKLVPNYFSLAYFPLLREIRKFNPDVINIHWTHGTTIPIQLIAKLAGIWPVFWTLHDMWPITKNTSFEYSGGMALREQPLTLKKRLKKRLTLMPDLLFDYKIRTLGSADIHTISPSAWLQHKAMQSPVFSSATHHHIPNGVDIDIFRPLDRAALRKAYGIGEDQKVVLFLSARLDDQRKGFYYYAKALEHLREVDPGLIGNLVTLLIGKNSAEASEHLSGAAMNLGSTRDVSTLVEYYNLADVFVSASIADNFPSTSLESSACGTPVVAFDVGGLAEIVVHNETGLLAENKNAVALAENLRNLLNDRDLQQRLSAGCREHAVNQLGMEKFVSSYLTLFGEAVMEPGSRIKSAEAIQE